eukprot:jgi/Chrzof1/1315/Cz10g02220.t1
MLQQLLSPFMRGYRRIPNKGFKVLTSKHRNRFYKGKGSMKTGVHTSTGRFIVLPRMMPQYVVPDLTGFTLKPYVANYQHSDGSTTASTSTQQQQQPQQQPQRS